MVTELTRSADLFREFFETTHQQSVYMGKTYLCEGCDYQAKWKSQLIRHQMTVYICMKYPCVECGYKATHKSSLIKHQHSVHISNKYPTENIQD